MRTPLGGAFVQQGAENLFPYRPYPEQVQFMSDVELLAQKGGVGLFEAPTGFGKTAATLSALLGYVDKPIVYLTRTHNQMRQVAKELREVNRRGCDFKGVVRGSRRFLCLISEVRACATNAEMIESCLSRLQSSEGVTLLDFVETGSASVTGSDLHLRVRADMTCSFQGRTIEVPIDIPQGIPAVADVETLVRYGREFHICPYFLARLLAQSRRVVVGSYKYLFIGDLSIKGAFLVLDEAHNIDALCREAYSLQLSQRSVEQAIAETQEGEDFGAINWEELSIEVHEFFKRVTLPKTETAILTQQQTLDLLEEYGLGDNFLKSVKAAWTDLCQLHAELMQIRGRVFPLESLRTHSIFTFFHRLMEDPPEQFVAILETQALKRLAWTCLDPALAFREIREKNPHAIILMSGTLSPMVNLGRMFEVETIIHDYPSIVPLRNVQVLVLRTGPYDDPLTSEYKHRNNPAIGEAYGETIQQIVTQVPNGSLVFFPSYGFMRQLLRVWSQQGILERMKDTGYDLFFETPEAGKSLIDKYKEQARSGNAVLFAVCRGKLSEGADFPDATGRAAILVGVPFPDLSDPKVKAQRQYYENKSQGLGATWYLDEAIRTVNQTLGRVWRHHQDYALGCLLDGRYYWRSNFEKISPWLRSRMRFQTREDSFSSILHRIKAFFNRAERRYHHISSSKTT